MISTDEMRQLIALLENSLDDHDDDEEYDTNAMNDAVERMRRDRIIRQNPPKFIAKTQLGDLYQLSDAMIQNSELIKAFEFEPKFSKDLINCVNWDWHNDKSNFIGVFYIPNILYATIVKNRRYHIGRSLEILTVVADSEQELEIINAIDRSSAFDDILYRRGLMRDRNGFWQFAERSLKLENKSIDVDGLKNCWLLDVEWVWRARKVLKEWDLSAYYANKKVDHIFLAIDQNERKIIAAFRNGQLVGTTVPRYIAQDQVRNITKRLEPVIGATPTPSLIEPHHQFHDMLQYIANNPGTSRTGWWHKRLGYPPGSLPPFDGALDGMAARLGLITIRDPGSSDSKYQLKITPKGKDLLDKLNDGKSQDIDQLIH